MSSKKQDGGEGLASPKKAPAAPHLCVRTDGGDVHCGVVVQPPAPAVAPAPLSPKDPAE